MDWSVCGPRDKHGHWGKSLNWPVVTAEFCGIRGGGGEGGKGGGGRGGGGSGEFGVGLSQE